MILWDREGAPPDPGEVLLWRSHAGRSVPAYVETHAERLRAKYLAFIYELGQSLIEPLTFEGGLSFWWMTRLAEKSPFKSPGIYTALRLFALEEMLLADKPARLELDSGDDHLCEAVAALCCNLGIDFVRRPGAHHGGSLRDHVPHPVKGLYALVKHLATRWTLRRIDRSSWFSGDDAVFICSFFAHLDTASCARGEFRSHYWETLPRSLQDSGRRVNWLHHYLHGYSSDAPDARTSVDWLSRFNADVDRQGRHAFLDSYLSWGVAVRAVRSWLRLNLSALHLRDVSEAFTPKGSAVRLWPVLREDWRTSLSGRVGAVNCLWVELFDAALRDIPTQKTGLYLCENQSWETALLHAWRKHGHGEIIGVAHTTVPFWHLYNLDDQRAFAVKPVPDRLAVNGPAAMRVFAGAGHPIDKLVEVEALRYLDLPRLPEKRVAHPQTRILVLGDVIPESMHSLLSNLGSAVHLLPVDYRFTLKLHPLYAVDLAAYPGLHAETTTAPLESILGEFDVALAANSTSAAVDAYQAGLPVIVGLNGADLNLSPLRGEPGVRFVGTPQELAEALRQAGRTTTPRDGFFYLDAGLPRWRRFLKMGTH